MPTKMSRLPWASRAAVMDSVARMPAKASSALQRVCLLYTSDAADEDEQAPVGVPRGRDGQRRQDAGEGEQRPATGALLVALRELVAVSRPREAVDERDAARAIRGAPRSCRLPPRRFSVPTRMLTCAAGLRKVDERLSGETMRVAGGGRLAAPLPRGARLP